MIDRSVVLVIGRSENRAQRNPTDRKDGRQRNAGPRDVDWFDIVESHRLCLETASNQSTRPKRKLAVWPSVYTDRKMNRQRRPRKPSGLSCGSGRINLPSLLSIFFYWIQMILLATLTKIQPRPYSIFGYYGPSWLNGQQPAVSAGHCRFKNRPKGPSI